MENSTKSKNKLTVNFGKEFDTSCCSFNKFPFKTVLSLEKLIETWESATKETTKMKSKFATPIIEKVNAIPGLKGAIKDKSILDKNEDLLDVLMSLIYPSAQWDKLIAASTEPFQWEVFYNTPLFEKIFALENNVFKVDNQDPKAMLIGKTINAYLYILRDVYKIDLSVGQPFVMGVLDNKTNLQRYFQLTYDPSFVKIKVNGKKPELSEETLKLLLKDINNLDNWVKYLPPEKFEFHGFVNLNAVNVTDQQVLSQLKHDLLERESIISSQRFKILRNKLRDLFRIPKLKFGLAAIPKDWNQINLFGRKIGESFMFNFSETISCNDFENSIYDRVMKKGKTIIIENISEYEEKTIIEEELLKLGINNISVSPLYYEDDLIGFLEIGTPNAGEINSLNSQKISGLLPLFSIAVKRGMEELENNVQALIKEECTAIHPTVEWRFKQAAHKLLLKRDEQKNAEMESIVFDKVYPLYGLSDIRNSSTIRNDAIRSDLVEHLKMAHDIILSAEKLNELPYLDSLNFRIENQIENVKNGLSSGDELGIIEFLQKEVESIFPHLGKSNSSIAEMIDNYKKTIDPNLNSFYQKRKDFEESVATINESITKFLDEAEEKSQQMYPHYFERYKTDGVEHGIYIGQSLVDDKPFDMLYLKNLRLWQLIVMCGIVKQTDAIKPFLKIPLDTAHLILIQDSALSIRFRLDEKKFDVDGTYNIRYEIMKKRIDKAVINGTKERLTQPNKIAMVYSQNKEAAEYRKYIEYLISKGYLENEIEELDLESLQGVQGLRALRVTVNLKTDKIENSIDQKEVSEAIEKIEKETEAVGSS